MLPPDGVGVGVTVADGVGVGAVVGEGAGVTVGVGVGVGEDVGVGVGVGVGDGVEALSACSVIFIVVAFVIPGTSGFASSGTNVSPKGIA